ncbi:hypothetical protein ACGFIP_31070 [Micromonospora zamorensis]|uniref:hypothetical protein n=1 Tax=Micromonospora zamorensis TaxID=709883 RepID=UPI00371A6811
MADEVVNVLALEYAERRLIVVQRDEEVVVQRRGLGAPPRLDEGVAAAAGRALKKSDALLSFVLTNPAVAAAGVAVAAGAAVTAGAVMAWKRSSARSPVSGMLPMRMSEIGGLQLPLGHPQYDTVYVGHPARPIVYYPLADFHRRTFEHKFSEALRLVTGLGATTIKVSAVQGWGREFSTDLRVGLPTADGGSAKAASNPSRKREFLYSAELAGSAEPVVPADLVWFPHEDAWQEIARQRIEHGLRSFEMRVNYQDDYSVTAELAADVVNAKFKLGGKFQRQQSTIWAINGKFAR